MTIKKRRNRFLLCGSGSSGTVSPRSSPSNSSSTISTSSGYVSLRLGFSTRLKIFFRRILSRFRSNRKRIHPKRQSSISLMEDHSLSIIMELPEQSESSLTSGTQIAPSPRPLSSGVQNIINRLSEKQPMSCSSRGSVQSLWSENENVSPTAADLSPQPPSISNMFDVANLSPEALEKTLVNQQINPYDEHEEASSESMEVNKAYCRNENAKQREKPISLISSTASCELPGAMGTVVEKTNCCTTTVKMENRTESKSVQFQNNVIVYPSPSGVVDTNSSSGQKTVESLSDLRSEGLRVGEDCKARRPATPGKPLNEGETTASPPVTPAPMNEGEKTVSPPQTSTYVTVKDPDYTPRTPRNTVKPESDKGKTSLPQCTASSQQTKTLIEESKGDLYVKEVGNSSSLDNDIPPEEVCAKRSWSRLDLSTYPTNDDCFRTSEKVLSGEERNEKVRKNMSDVNVVATDRQELEEKARRRADRKKRKEMRMAAEGYIKEQENLPQEEKRKFKKKAKKKNIQKNTAINSEEPAGQQEYRHQAVMRLEAERDTTNLNGQEGSDGNVTFEDKLLHWEKMKTTGDNRSLGGQEETNKPARKMRTKKKKNRELPAAGDKGMGTEKAKRKERTHMEHDVKNEDILGSGEETGECIEPIEQAMHPHKKPHKYNESRYIEDTVLKHSSDDEIHTYHVDHSKIYCEDHSKIRQADSNFLDEIGKEKLSKEERRKKQTKRKKMKEAIAAGNEHSNDMRKEYPDDQVITQMSREDNDYQREHVTDQDKIEGMQQEIAEILGLSSNSDQAQRIKQGRGMVNKDTNHIFRDEQGCENSGNQKSEDFDALRYERDSAIGFQNEKGNAKSKSKLMNVTCGERIQQQKSRQKRKVKNLNDDQLSSAVSTSENPIIHDGYPVITDSVSPQTVMNEDVLDVNPIPLTSSYESNAPVQSESNKKYVHAGVGPTHSEDVSQKAVHVAKTKPVTVASGERRRKSSNKNRDNRDNSTTDEVSSTYVKGHKQSPGGQHIGQQYSVDHHHVSLYPEEEEDDHTVNFHKDLSSQVPTWAPGNQPRMQDRVQTAENYLLIAEQDSSLETPGIGGNRKGHFNEEDRVTQRSSTYPRERDASNHINITTRDGDLLPTAPTSPESDEDRQQEQVSSRQGVKDHYLSITELDRPRPVGCDVDINLGREMKSGLESAVRRMNQLGTYSGSISRPESRSLWSTSTMSIPHSIQEEDETEESEDQTGQDPSDEDRGEEISYTDTGQENHIKYPAPGPREELAPNVFKVDKMNLPPVCVVQKEDVTKSASVRKPGHSTIQTGKEQDSRTEDIRPVSKQVRVDDIQSRSSPELETFLAQYSDLKSDVEASLIPDQTWEEITKPIGQFRPKARYSADKPQGIQGQKLHITEGNDEPSIANPTPTMLPAHLNRKQRAHYEKLQVTFRAPEKNLPGAQFWKDLNADKLVSEAVSQDLFIKTPFGHIFPNECENQQMSPIKAYRDDHSHQSDAALDETGYESMEQLENYDNSPESLSDLRNKLSKICSEEVESDPAPRPQSPPGGTDMIEVSTDPRFWKSHDSSGRDSSRLSAEILSRIENCAAQNVDMLQFADGNSSYEDEQFQEDYKEPSYAPSLIDRYHSKNEENIDFFRCVSRGSLNNIQSLRTEEENIARSFARTDSREHTVDDETVDANLLFFKTVARYPEFYEQEIETTDSKVVKSRCGRRSPGFIPDDPSNYISGEVAHQNLEFFRAVARDTSFFKLPDKEDQDSEDNSDEDSTPPRNKLEADSYLQKDDATSCHKDRSHHHTKMPSQKPASKILNRFQRKTLAEDHLDSQKTGPPHLSKLYSKRTDGLSLLQPVVSPCKAKENMDFFLQVSKDPHFYKIAEKPEVPVMVAPHNKPKSYKGINVNSGRPIGKKGLGFKSRLT